MKARYAVVAMISAVLAMGSLTGCGGDGAQEPAGSTIAEANKDAQASYAEQLGYELSEVVEYQGIVLKVDPSWDVKKSASGECRFVVDKDTYTAMTIVTALHGQTQTLESAWEEYFAMDGTPMVTDEWNNNGFVSGVGSCQGILLHYACEIDSGKGFLMYMTYGDEFATDEQAEGLFDEVASTIAYTPANTAIDYSDEHSGGGSSSAGATQGSSDADTEQQPAAPETPSYGEGTYKIGADLPAGEYKLTSVSDDAYWEVKNSSDADADIVGNDIFSGSAYVTVYDGQYLTLRRCTAEPAA